MISKSKDIERIIKGQLELADEVAMENQRTVLEAFRRNQVSDFHLNPSSGYGYDDEGRDTLEKVYADVFKSEKALVRPQIISGTHAITISLFGILRPGDELLYITGKPYDTLEKIVSSAGSDTGSLADFGIGYHHVDLLDGNIDWETVKQKMTSRTKMVGIQRSRGYDTRPSFSVSEIRQMAQKVREIAPNAVIFVDNCYGEFVETSEPIEAGADLMAGSLIKNPGGGLAKVGGYITGRADLVEKCAYRMTSPGIGGEAGPSLDTLRDMYQGFFMAPHIVGQAVKGAIFTAALLESLGMETNPHYTAKRTDLVQSVSFTTAEQMIRFCQAIQANSPVNAHYRPEPAYMPGYKDDVIMAAGTFIQGASIELTADGPIRPPFTAFVQGGLTYEHVKIAVLQAAEALR